MPRQLTNRLKWKDKTEEELIRLLQTEITRIGHQDNPRRIPIQALYDNQNMPSPSYYESRFKMKWPAIVEKAGMPLKSIQKKGVRLKHVEWLEKSDEYLLELLKDEIIRLDFQEYPSMQKVHQRYDRSNMPPPRVYRRHFGIPWKELLERTGVVFEREALKHSPFRWQDGNDEEYLDLLKAELERMDILDDPSMIRYQKGYDNQRVPSPSYYLKRFDCGWVDVLLKIGIRYGKYKLT